MLSFSFPSAPLGGLSTAQFLRRHWQRRPALLRAAVPAGFLDRRALFALAQQDDVESRLVQRRAGRWSLRHGPFERLPALKTPDWTLLVQGVEAHLPAARALMDAFRFLPDARLDDVMVSWAADGGGVGPHVDAYDVFLVQVAGRRRWRVSHQKDLGLVAGLPLKILRDFRPELDWVLEPGDILYLPPGWAHDGVALGGDCITASVGFRAPSRFELVQALLPRLLDADEDEAPAPLRRRYADPGLAPSAHPAEVPAALQAFAREALERVLADPMLLARALGEHLSEPKLQQVFDAPLGSGAGLRLAPGSRMLYDAQGHLFLNGESYRASGRDAQLLRALADARTLSAADAARLSAPARELVQQWMEEGWLWPLNPST